ADAFGDADRDRRGSRLGCDRGKRLAPHAQRPGDGDGRRGGGCRSGEERGRDRQGRAPELPEVVEKWQGERDRRGTEQEVDELRALEIGPVGSAGRPEDDGQDHNRHENGVDVGLAPRGAKTSIPRRIGEKRQREPEERPFGKVAPERREVSHRPPPRDGRRGRRPPRLPRWQGRWTRRARQAVRPPGCRVWRYGRRPPPRPERREVRGWRGYPRP